MAQKDGGELSTLTGVLKNAAERYPDNDALISSGGPQLTYAELQSTILRTAAMLQRSGLKPGDLISLAFPNTIEFVVVFLAVIRARGVAAPLNSAYTEEEFYFYMEDAKTSLLLVPGKEGNKAAEAAADRLGLPIAGVHWEKDNTGSGNVVLLPKSRLELTSDSENLALPEPLKDDEALFLHTSGTTSRPKGVPLTQLNLASSVLHIVEAYELNSLDKTVVVLPLFHVHGLMCSLLSSLAAGGTVILPAAGRFSATAFWSDMKRYGATWYTAVPTIHQILLARHKSNPESEYPHLRFIRSCSASLAPAVMTNIEEAFSAPVLEAYAMTEASHQMTANPLPSHGPRKPGSVGKPTGIELTILSDNGDSLPPGEVGEVCIRGPNVTKGYKNNPEANEKAFEFAWFHTGDRGYIDEDGYLHLTGRIKELINYGGEKISPMEVDAILLAHPNVAEAVAFAAPDEKYGEVVNAAVVPNKGEQATAESILNFCKKNLAPFKVPKRLFFAEQLPRTATGKIQRRIVAEHFLKNPKS
ncbi:hypothetical protein O6H91_09G091600 [Diphasiastrum complanatum]|uniref:Uncharacterized protein n=4 Tax=Diphasiastrum complanatum TaxID=34168 RepID=A0ACC2CS20_DIPCM|nr:hypothetical protein O6H91_09G091600 [Diphasiastrum complanatum]KAJ7544751.1 hypothetical protein O6H91_09G091600 [Diphasiastrum complanatum]KAJ7544752.1 hypothetical protein O6H91_09G091600 [Diphasiastrum complanatum]KAJ7544753.1 hypothetical protein O6H91_09G091600 [Diphasiastrum complanatum]